jgi:hypothetical protein
MRFLRTPLALFLASAALAACSDQPTSAPTDPSRPRVIIPAAVNGDLAPTACDFTQLKSDSRAFVAKSNDVLLTIAGSLQQEVGKRGRTRTATNLVLDGLSRIAAVRGTADQNSAVTASVFNSLVHGWLACAENAFLANAQEPDVSGGFGLALGSHWVFEVRGKAGTDPAGGAYERSKPTDPPTTQFWALEPGEVDKNGAPDWAASIGGSLGLDRVFIYGYQTSNDVIPAKFGSSFEHRTIPKISSTFTLSFKVGLCGLDAQDGRRVDHADVFLPLVQSLACETPAAIDAGSSIYALQLLNPISLAQRAIGFLAPQPLHAAIGVVGGRGGSLSPSSVFDLSKYVLDGLGTIADGRTSKQLALTDGSDVTVHVSVEGTDAPVGTPVTVSVVGNSSSIAFFKDGLTGATGPTVTRPVGAGGIASFGKVFLTKAGGYQIAFQVALPNASGGFDFTGANVITSNSFNYQGK